MEFQGFQKIARLSKEIVITEKIDGTNAQIYISEDGSIKAGSRNRWLSIGSDNFGFAKWVEDNKEELLKLGPGRHFGEWWGVGIQRGYGLSERRFSLFNVNKWNEETKPKCCHVVPVLGKFESFSTNDVYKTLGHLDYTGSIAAPGYMNPEGIIIYHTGANIYFKKTFEKDGGKRNGKS